jgi:hypothetical protein
VRADVEPERRVLAGHERRVGDDPQHPAVQAEHEVEDVLRVSILEEHKDAGDENEDADEPETPSGPGEHARDTELRDAEQPPTEEGKPRRRSCG